MTIVASVIYVVIILWFGLSRGTLKINDSPVENPIARMLAAAIFVPVVGVIFTVLGYVLAYAGKFLLLPFVKL